MSCFSHYFSAMKPNELINHLGLSSRPSPPPLQAENRLFIPFCSSGFQGGKPGAILQASKEQEGNSFVPPGGKGTSRDMVVVMLRLVTLSGVPTKGDILTQGLGLLQNLPLLRGRDALAHCLVPAPTGHL